MFKVIFNDNILLETDKILHIYDIINFDNNYYSIYLKDSYNKIFKVKKIKLNKEPHTLANNKFKCPYCNFEEIDGYQKYNNEYFCKNCGSNIFIRKKDKYYFIQPIALSNIIKL